MDRTFGFGPKDEGSIPSEPALDNLGAGWAFVLLSMRVALPTGKSIK